MTDQITNIELEHFGITILSPDQILLNGETISVDSFFNSIIERYKKIQDLQKDIISEVNKFCYNSVRDTSLELSCPSLGAMKYFLKEVSSISFYDLSKQSVMASTLNRCGLHLSAFSRKNIILCKMTFKWLNYLLKKDIYLYDLVSNTLKEAGQLDPNSHHKMARGIQGPWGNLDLPMQERVFKWDDVSEETYGRRADIQKQRRYVMGLEDMNDPNVKVGYYYRELRNEPYLFSDSDTESPYPHRNVLWES
ncbi:hypothetical protein CMI47_23515 [Candidatus Pacearchaeota archaeon]|nr:hypothetical protein [Candidatus Pacearchaeota archaeon]